MTVSQLTIVSTANTSTVTPGGVVVYTTTLTNAGQTPYTGISVSFGGTPGDATSNGDQTASSGTLSVGTTGAVWTGDIPVGGTVTLTGSVTVADPYPGGPVMALLLVSAAPGSNCPDGSTDPRCAPAVDVLIPGLSITQSADTASRGAGPGDRVHADHHQHRHGPVCRGGGDGVVRRDVRRRRLRRRTRSPTPGRCRMPARC